MPKTRLSNEKRDLIVNYMVDELKKKTEGSNLDLLFKKFKAEFSQDIRENFPEREMKVLRKYDFHAKRMDYHVVIPGTGQSVHFNLGSYGTDVSDLADHPIRKEKGMLVREETVKAYEKWRAALEERQQFFRDKRGDYRSFVETCKTVEDVEEIVPLPVDLRERLGARNNALVAINSEKIHEIQNDFKEAK